MSTKWWAKLTCATCNRIGDAMKFTCHHLLAKYVGWESYKRKNNSHEGF